MGVEAFRNLLRPLTDFVDGKHPDQALQGSLARQFPPDGALFADVELACANAIAAGWMCSQGGAGRRFGRVLDASPATSNVSVDVVALTDIVGPHHRHPNGEICMVMPVDPGARFDGHPRGWVVYEPGSAHRPTVTNGEARVLYLLPGGNIEFTGE